MKRFDPVGVTAGTEGPVGFVGVVELLIKEKWDLSDLRHDNSTSDQRTLRHLIVASLGYYPGQRKDF